MLGSNEKYLLNFLSPMDEEHWLDIDLAGAFNEILARWKW